MRIPYSGGKGDLLYLPLMKYRILVITMLLMARVLPAQLRWTKVDTGYGVLPRGFALYKTTDSLEGKPFAAWYAIALLKDRSLYFTTDTTMRRRLTPAQFYEKNDHPLLVVNGTFFSFATNQNLNVIMQKGRLLSYNVHTIAGKGKDTLRYHHMLGSAIGISRKRKADVAWLFTDSSQRYPVAFENDPVRFMDSLPGFSRQTFLSDAAVKATGRTGGLVQQWKMRTAIGGGPVLIHDGRMRVTNNEEMKFTGKAIEDKHPRTAMGYTADGRLIILVIEGRFPGVAEGASLTQEARLLLDLGCIEALNLDGGGSSCMLINGRETIRPSDKTGQRPVPGVFLVQLQ